MVYKYVIKGGGIMGIQKCKNCGTKFEYKDLLKSVLPAETG